MVGRGTVGLWLLLLLVAVVMLQLMAIVIMHMLTHHLWMPIRKKDM